MVLFGCGVEASKKQLMGMGSEIMTRIHFFALALLLSGSKLLAQGSTGGTLGKTDQELSGGGPKQQNTTAPKAKAETRKATSTDTGSGSCAKIVGTWNWFDGSNIIFHQNGTGQAHGGQ